MLFRLVEQICTAISALDEKEDGQAMFEQICMARPDFLGELQRQAKIERNKLVVPGVDLVTFVGMKYACICLCHVKSISEIAATMVRECQMSRTDPRVRCAVVGALAYLVQPRDLIPDDAPGGYGYIDDCVLLRVTLRECLNLTPSRVSDAAMQEKCIELLGRVVSEPVLPQLQLAVQAISLTFQTLAMLPLETARMLAEQIIANPLQMATPQPAPGFQPRPAPSLDPGSWHGGVYIEHGDVIVPGGPALIGGQFTPPPLPTSFWG
ncbi:MAG: DUF1232 domain-containing protein [Acidobacteria bacterium]|nr:DUF1232 domain-containing protein [Acidobacteriota bacterium]